MNMRASSIAVGMAFVVLTASGCAVTPSREAVSTHIDDGTITSAIKARHAESSDVAITGVSVETLYGVVLLSGFVNSPQEKIAAQNIAVQVHGVKAVRNEIVIQPLTSRPGSHPVRPDNRPTGGSDMTTTNSSSL